MRISKTISSDSGNLLPTITISPMRRYFLLMLIIDQTLVSAPLSTWVPSTQMMTLVTHLFKNKLSFSFNLSAISLWCGNRTHWGTD